MENWKLSENVRKVFKEVGLAIKREKPGMATQNIPEKSASRVQVANYEDGAGVTCWWHERLNSSFRAQELSERPI
jgi:hypothetical protein